MSIRSFLLPVLTLFTCALLAQPRPCGDDPAMTPTCAEACAICDIDGFTGRNNSTVQGQGFAEFCTTQFNNFNYIAFVPATVDIEIAVDVTNCNLNEPWAGLEIGIFESFDCTNFRAMTFCDTDILEGETAIFTNDEPLNVGQHYYLIMDGSGGTVCDWTFRVLSGSTALEPLTTSGQITGPEVTCPGETNLLEVTGTEASAALFFWSIDGAEQTDFNRRPNLTFTTEGNVEVCVVAANVCDAAPPSCKMVRIRRPNTLVIDTILCQDQGQALAVADTLLTTSGDYNFVIPLPNGCDSFIQVRLLALPQARQSIDVNLCVGEEFFIGDTPYSTTGRFIDTVRTASACDSIVRLDLFMIECEIRGTTDFRPPVCFGEATGQLIFSVENGTPPFSYDYANILAAGAAATGTTNLLENNVITGVAAGVYEINVRDDFGNDVVFFQEVIEPAPMFAEATAWDINGVNVSCFGGADGSATATGIGGVPPYTYLWSDNQTNALAAGLAAGAYTVSVTDASGCVRLAQTTLVSPSAVVADVNFIDPNCDGPETGVVIIDAMSGGTAPYRVSLNGGPPDTLRRFDGLSEGSHRVIVMDANDCPLDTSAVTRAAEIPAIVPWSAFVTQLGCAIPLTTRTNNVSIASVRWFDPGATLDCDTCLSPVALPLDDTEYRLTVTSADGCATTDSLFVQLDKNRDVFQPTAFSPNGDGVNDFFTLGLGKAAVSIASLEVYGRWGEQLFSATDLPPNEASAGWDGRQRGEPMEPGIYVWMARVRYLDGVTLALRGEVMLVR